MDVKLKFFFYLASVACFVLAALAQGGRAGSLGRAGSPPVGLLPLGLALFVFPIMWDTGVVAF